METTSGQWSLYAQAVKKRDEARRQAELHEKERRKAWREYYTHDQLINQLNEDLGLNDVAKDDAPPAPKKLKFTKKE